MRGWARYLICTVAGLGLGAGAAAWHVRAGAWGSSVRIGPWTTGTDLEPPKPAPIPAPSSRCAACSRCRGARRAITTPPLDDGGRPLDGRCRYRVSGGEVGGQWWSLTLYDRDGYLVANPANIYSVPSTALPPAELVAWSVAVAPSPQPGRWLPTGGLERFELTLRVYLPEGGGGTNLPRERLPRIERLSCP